MAENKHNEELQNEEPMEIGAGFMLKILIGGLFLVSLVVGIPYLLMK